jgi:hypothetical protein
MCVTYLKVVVTDVLCLLQLTGKIIATALRDGTERLLFYMDLVPKITSMVTPDYIYALKLHT